MPASSRIPAAVPVQGRPPLPARLFAAADTTVVALHDHGFLQSLVIHVAGLLALALLVIEPPAAGPAPRLHLAFAPADAAVIHTAAVAQPADDAPAASGGSVAAVETVFPLPEASAVVAPIDLVALDPVDSAAAPPIADADLAALVAAVPVTALTVSARPAARAFGSADGRGAGQGIGAGHGDGAGQGGGIGGEIGRRLRAAGARTGDVQVSIAWNNVNDIDVHVLVESPAFVPGASLVNYTNRRGVCGGWLDVDENVLPRTPLAVENVFWARGAAPPGRYTVAVHHYRNWGGPDPTPVEIVVLLDGWQKRFEALVHAGRRPVVVTSFVRRPGDTSWLEADGWIPATGP